MRPLLNLFALALLCLATNSRLLAAQANDNFADRTVLPAELPLAQAASNIGATREPEEQSHAGSLEASVWWSWTAPENVVVQVSTAGSDFDTVLAVYRGSTLGQLTLVAANDDGGGGATSLLVFEARQGLSYQIAVDGYVAETGFGDMGNILLTLERVERPPNDHFANRTSLFGAEVQSSGTNLGATAEQDEPHHFGAPALGSVWWEWTAPEAGDYYLSTEGSSIDTLLSIYKGDSLATLSLVASDDDSGGNLTSASAFAATEGEVFAIMVAGYDGDSGDIQLSIRPHVLPDAPDWTLPSPLGGTGRWEQYQGKVVLLNFWATWCGPCIVEIPDLISLHRRYQDQGFAVVGLSTDAGSHASSLVRDFISTHDINYPIYMADGAVTDGYGGIAAIPTTFIIGRDGKIHWKIVGAKNEAFFESLVVPLLEETIEPLQLAVALQGGQIRLSWPSVGSWQLQEAESPQGDWQDAGGMPQAEGDFLVLRLEKPLQNRFYRLRH